MARAIGRYELLRPLARGGMAEVFLARRRSGGLEKHLVIKRIRAERAGDVRFLELFVREARLSMTLTHQNIVPVFDFGRIGDQVFLAMERVEGHDLGSSLARGTPPPPIVAAFIAAECCRALAYAHQRHGAGEHLGIVHRDVTPRNVLLSWSGEVKLTDFGIAALAGDEAGRLVGTPAYMAPEQARGEPVDARADVYALGLVLREAATGVRARPGNAREALVDAARRNELDPWPPGCPAAIVAIVDRATTSVAAERYPDTRAMLAAIDEYIVAERAAHTTEPPDRQLADWLARAWEGAREDAAEEIDEQPAILSMFDDGELGSGTQRSLAATVDGEPPRANEPSTPIVTPPQRRWFAVIAVAVLGVLAAGIAMVTLGGTRSATRPDAAAPADAALAEPPVISVDAALVVPSDAAPAPADAPPPPVVVDARVARPVAPDAVVASEVSPDAARAQVLRKVRINARPWATFTVDGGSLHYETISTIDLAPGTHQLHFSNPQLGVERDVTIVVPPDRDLDHVEDLRR